MQHCTFLLQFLEETLEILGSLKLLVPEAPQVPLCGTLEPRARNIDE